MSFWYLASPYSKYPQGLNAAFEAVCQARGLLVKAKIPCFSPIIHSHSVAMICNIDPSDYKIWLPAEEPILRAAKGLIVLMLNTWNVSYGIGVEMDIFKNENKPIIFMTPGTVPEELF